VVGFSISVLPSKAEAYQERRPAVGQRQQVSTVDFSASCLPPARTRVPVNASPLRLLSPPFAPSAHLRYNTRAPLGGATPMEERLQKIMARAGFGSRRACEEMIRRDGSR
jgi:hypothetical protein